MIHKFSYLKSAMEKSTYWVKFGFFLLLSVVVYGCSSGGGDSPAPAAKSDAIVQGSVVKGVIKNATVDIYAINNGQISASPLTSVNTNSSGAYSFTLSPDFNGPVKVEVHDNSANNATMTCDNVTGCVDGVNSYQFGEDMPLGSVVLKTYVQNVSGGSAHTASITPFTLMAAAYADYLAATAGYNATVIAQANSQVGNLLSISNIVTTTPPDITSPSAANADSNSLKYALLSAAITAIAQQDHGGNIMAAITALVDSITTTAHEGQLINTESSNSPGVISLAEIINSAHALSSQLAYSGSVTSELSNLLLLADDQNNPDLWTDAEPSPTSGLGELATVKAFVADVRTWGHVIEEDINGTDTGPLQQRLEAAGITMDIAGPLLGDAFGYAITAAFEAYATSQDIPDLTIYSPDPLNPVTADSGSALITGNRVTVVGALNGTDFNMVIDFPGATSGTEFSLTMNSATVSNADAEIVLTQPSGVTISYANSYPGGIDLTPWREDPDYTMPFPEPDSGSLNLAVEINELGVANAVRFQGSMQLALQASQDDAGMVIRDVTGSVVNYNPSSASISGSISSGTNSFNANASATMPNAAGFMPTNYWLEDIGSYSFSNSGNTLTLVAHGYERTFTFVASDQPVVITDVYPWNPGQPSVSLTNDVYSDMETFLNSGYGAISGGFWTYVQSVDGYYNIPLPGQFSDWNPAGGTLDGTLDWGGGPEEVADNYRQISEVSVSFNAQLVELPAATFTLTGDRTGLDNADLELDIAYGSRRIHAIGSVAENSASGTITITNQDGVVLTIDLDGVAQRGSVRYDQTEYAVIENVRGVDIIRYNDGYFEIF